MSLLLFFNFVSEQFFLNLSWCVFEDSKSWAVESPLTASWQVQSPEASYAVAML